MEREAVSDPARAWDLIRKAASRVGREVHVFVRPAALSTSEGSNTPTSPRPAQEEEPDDFYEFTAEDYARVMASKKKDVFLKTKKIREEEGAARRARFPQATVRVQFPDSYILEATFQSTDSVGLLTELLQKVVLRPELPFHLYTTPPKQYIKNLDQSMYDAGFAPGAYIYFAYQHTKGDEVKGSYLRHDIQALRDVHLLAAPIRNQTRSSSQEHLTERDQLARIGAIAPSNSKRVDNSPGGRPKPKWLKM